MGASAGVVGGGIGGPAAAIGLRLIGWEVTVIERAACLADVGAGISLHANGPRALDVLGVGGAVRAAARPQYTGGTRTPGGSWLARMDGAAPEREPGTPIVGIPRAVLHGLLRAAGGVAHRLRTDLGQGRRVRPHRLHRRPGRVARGAQLTARHSACGRTCRDAPPVRQLARSDPRAAGREPAARRPAPRHPRAGDTPASFTVDRIVLLGDAAHAMPPNLGQGACQALEDAAVLAAALATECTVGSAVARYDAERHPRSQSVAHAAHQAGRVGQRLAHPLIVAARNTALRLVPSRTDRPGRPASCRLDATQPGMTSNRPTPELNTPHPEKGPGDWSRQRPFRPSAGAPSVSAP